MLYLLKTFDEYGYMLKYFDYRKGVAVFQQGAETLTHDVNKDLKGLFDKGIPTEQIYALGSNITTKIDGNQVFYCKDLGNRITNKRCFDLKVLYLNLIYGIIIFEKYKIWLFEKSKNKDMYLTYSVRLRNSGSRHDSFNITFMKMYQKLQKYNPKGHQINIKEYLYQKKLQRKL